AVNITGVVPNTGIAGTYSNLVVFTHPANGFTGDGSGLTGLNAANISTGVVSLARGGTSAGTVAEARTNLGAAASGLNSDITALLGLSTPLAIVQGGTGAGTASNALVNLGGASLTESNQFSGVNLLLNPFNSFVGIFSGDGSGLTGLN